VEKERKKEEEGKERRCISFFSTPCWGGRKTRTISPSVDEEGKKEKIRSKKGRLT